ncbi:MAG: nitrite/sulfite reductase [Hungatella sp.]|nr:nitrite/sulfite reductase [Hungatella sp.]
MTWIDPQIFKADFEEFREKTKAFYAGELDKGAYKKFSGYFGSYAQKGGKANMLRLRMPAGVVTKERLAFTARMVETYGIPRVHFTTCQTIQLHDLGADAACEIMEEALKAGIVTLGGGGDYPRNVMCSPLSGVEQDEYFDVLPWALAAGDYLLTFLKAEKLPRKLKVGFSNSLRNQTHATYRDLGFTARCDGRFDVYSAGGLGNQPRFGVKVAEAVEPEKILFYIKAMWLTFRAYGNYQNRGKARTRYMQESLGGPEAYKTAYLEKLEEVFSSGEDLTVHPDLSSVTKQGDGKSVKNHRALPQKQAGLYTVVWHPIGGQADPRVLCALSEALSSVPDAQLRLAPDETAYVINLTGAEAETVLKITEDSAGTLFESSVSCIGAGTCQQGIRDSQALLAACVEAVRRAQIPDGALPQIHISGCPSSCGTHQTGSIGFRGGAKKVDGVLSPAFSVYAGGDDRQGSEVMGQEVGVMTESSIPDFLVKLGCAVAESGQDYEAWNRANPKAFREIAEEFLV